jgi:hypothetical protein
MASDKSLTTPQDEVTEWPQEPKSNNFPLQSTPQTNNKADLAIDRSSAFFWFLLALGAPSTGQWCRFTASERPLTAIANDDRIRGLQGAWPLISTRNRSITNSLRMWQRDDLGTAHVQPGQ